MAKKGKKNVEDSEIGGASEEVKAKKESGKIGEIISVKIGESEYKGKCVSERTTNSGAQVYLQLNGCVSRWFSVENIVE